MTHKTKIAVYSWSLFLLIVALGLAIASQICAQPAKKVEEPGVQFEAKQAIPDQVQFLVLATPKLSTLPFIYSWQVQVKTAIWVYGDAWVEEGKSVYHAHLWRITIPNGYIWMVQGSSAWWTVTKAALSKSIEAVALLPLTQVGSSPQCKELSEALLVSVTSDAGTLQQPGPVRVCQPIAAPTDAGPSPDACHTENRKWPDGSVIQCGGSWWLLRSRLGGPEPVQWVDVDAGVVKPGTPSTKPTTAVKPTVQQLQAPDAATTHNCYGVPIGVACPK